MSNPLQLAPVVLVLGRNQPVAISARKPSQVAGDRFRPVPDTGLTIVALLSTSSGVGAAAIHASLQITLTEVTAGEYYGEILGADVTSHLTVYADTETPIYLVASSGSVQREVIECRVRSSALAA